MKGFLKIQQYGNRFVVVEETQDKNGYVYWVHVSGFFHSKQKAIARMESMRNMEVNKNGND